MWGREEIWDVCNNCQTEFEGIIPACKCYGLSRHEFEKQRVDNRKARKKLFEITKENRKEFFKKK